MNNFKTQEIELLQSKAQLLSLSEDEQKAIRGGCGCTYAGQPYSQGSTVRQADGVYKCQEDGSWQKISN